MSRPKNKALNVSITSPKGSLIAEINNLRKQLKDYKQLKKQPSSNNIDKLTKQHIFSSGSKWMKEQKAMTTMNKTTKQNYFRASREQFHSPNSKSKHSHNNLVIDTSTVNLSNEKKRHTSPMMNESMNKKSEADGQRVELRLQEIKVKERDRKLKLDIELNKLRKIISKLGPEQICQQLNLVIGLVNGSISQYLCRIERLQKNQKMDESDENLLIKRQQQQIDSLTIKLASAQQQNQHLSLQLQQVKHQQQSHQQTYNIYEQQRTHFIDKIQALTLGCKQWQQRSIQLQQENKILSSKLYKKEQQLLLINEDLHYLRLQTQTNKQQKKQIHQLYEKTLNQFRDFKRTKSIEIEQLQLEKDKWQQQSLLKRNQNDSINAVEEQKITLMKELSEMRLLCNLRTAQIQQKKHTWHETQKKLILLESELYKLKSDLTTVKNQKQYAEFQNQKLRQEIEHLKKYALKPTESFNNTYKFTVKQQNQLQTLNLTIPHPNLSYPKHNYTTLNDPDFTPIQQALHLPGTEERKDHFNKKLKDKQEKLKALEDIHSLIKKHRTNILP